LIVSEAWNFYKADKRIEGFSPQTLTAYEVQANLLIKHFGDTSLGNISFEQLKGYLATS
jgi:hypothetical protein